jgi:DNA replication protein DnaC
MAAPVEILERLLAAEVGATAARKLAGRLRFAHHPLDKRLNQFEFDCQPSIDRAVIAELATLRFVEDVATRCSLGPPGVGKSHLAIALGIAATEAGYRTYFTTAADLVAALTTAHLEGSWSAKMRTYTGPSLVVIDELSCLPMDAISAHWIFQVVSRCYERDSGAVTGLQPQPRTNLEPEASPRACNCYLTAPSAMFPMNCLAPRRKTIRRGTTATSAPAMIIP